MVYNVYRSETPGFSPAPSNRVAEAIAGTSLHDLDVVYPERYHYVVRAVDLAHGGEDANTRELSSVPTGPNVIGTWADDAGDTDDAKLSRESPWTILQGVGVSGAAYATGAYGNNLCAGLATPALLFDAGPQLEFWSRFDIENGWDKGELEISTDNGVSWQRVPMTYPGTSSYTSDACDFPTGSFFTGARPTYAAYSADLSAWTGQEGMLRWALSTDGSVNGAGWWIDEISITNVAVPSACGGADLLFGDGFESGNTSAWSN